MYTPIVGTLGYILSPQGEVLLLHRNARPEDPHYGKYNGLGGKMLAEEDVYTCMTREIEEESGLICQEMQLRGTINWKGFGRSGEDWLGFIFLITAFSGQAKTCNSEGELAWYPLSALEQLPLWEGDRFFLPLVFDKDPRPFYGYLPYSQGKPLSWHSVR
jgi:8-oxo-dGTP diphosphatase